MSSKTLTYIQSVIGWSALAIIFTGIVFSGANSPPYWTLMAIAVFCLFVGQMLIFVLRGEPKINRSILFPSVMYILVLAWCLIQSSPKFGYLAPHPTWLATDDMIPLISASPVDTAHGVMRLVAYGMIFWIAVQSSYNADRAASFLKAISIFLTILALYGLYAFFSGTSILGDTEQHNVVKATLVNRNSYATLAAFGLLASATNYYWQINARSSHGSTPRSSLRNFLEAFFSGAWIYLLGAVLNIAALLLTSSRAGTISGFAGLLVLLVLVQQKRKKLRISLISIVIILTPLVIILSGNVWQRLVETNETSLRFYIYEAMILNLHERLFTGHGLGAFQDTFRPHLSLETGAFEWSLAHNSYLENLWEMGLPAALLFYLALFWISSIIAITSFSSRKQKIRSVFALSCALTAAIHAGFDFSLQMPAISALFSFILGLGWAAHGRKSNRIFEKV